MSNYIDRGGMMLNFIDQYGKQYGALADYKVTNGVNGEKSISGVIYANDKVINGVDRGWRIQLGHERYCFIFANPIDEGDRVLLEFDAVHEFFFDMKKSCVYSELNGSNTAKAFLDFIFSGSGYDYKLETTIYAFEKESFGMKNRLDLFNDFISSANVEFTVAGKTIRILEKTGRNLSSVVKKRFNLNELKIEKDLSTFITYLKGYGALVDENDESKGRLEVEYLSPLAEVYGKLEGDPVTDERYSVAENLIERLKQDVDNSYGIAVSLDMKDLQQAGYSYERPHEGDYIMVINDELGFEQKIRIMSYTTTYDTQGNIVQHEVNCGSDTIVKKLKDTNDTYQKEIKNEIENAFNIASSALAASNDKNKVYQESDPPTNANEGDIWYQKVGEETTMNYWNGFEWIPFVNPSQLAVTAQTANQTAQQADTNASTALEAAGEALTLAQQISSENEQLGLQIADLVERIQALENNQNPDEPQNNSEQ